jgi:hypothetical protein
MVDFAAPVGDAQITFTSPNVKQKSDWVSSKRYRASATRSARWWPA